MDDGFLSLVGDAKRRRDHKRRTLSLYEVGQIAEAITQIETGQAGHAAQRLRMLLRACGYPEPAPVRVSR
jgi:hypothetical protein